MSMAQKKKMTTYIDEDLLRSAKILAARSDGKVYEIVNEALRRYLEEVDAVEAPLKEPSLAEALSDRQIRQQPRIPDGEALKLPENETLSEAVITERGERDY